MNSDAGLTPLQRERRDLGYRTRGPEFGINVLTALHGRADSEGGAPAPRVTFYAQPTEGASPLGLAALSKWLEPSARRYEPAPALLFVPPYQRGIVDGLLVHTSGRGERFDRFIAARRSGSVEYGVYCSWSHGTSDGVVWLLQEKQVILQFAQFLRFLDDLSGTFDRPKSWTVWCNARNVNAAVLVGFGEGWATPFDSFGRQPTYCLEERFQLEFSFAGGPENGAALVEDLAVRFELAFGFTSPRVYNRAGSEIGSITYADTRYE